MATEIGFSWYGKKVGADVEIIVRDPQTHETVTVELTVKSEIDSQEFEFLLNRAPSCVFLDLK